MHTVTTAKEIAEKFAGIGSNVKKSALLSGAWAGPYAVAAIVVDGIVPPAEVHAHAADVWVCTSGSATFTLGGELINSTEASTGEFNAPSIAGGESKDVSAGDVVDIPPGVAHQVDPHGERAEFLILKIPNL